jgi:hypothetical protein
MQAQKVTIAVTSSADKNVVWRPEKNDKIILHLGEKT